MRRINSLEPARRPGDGGEERKEEKDLLARSVHEVEGEEREWWWWW